MAYTAVDDPELYFQALAYTGQGGDNDAYTLSGDSNLQPDWVWIKNRGTTNEHLLIDSVRGALKALNSNDATATDTISNSLKSFNSDGFTLGGNTSCNADGNTYASWSWKAGGSASNNTDGNTTTSVSVNQTAGFSIMKYDGDGNESTIGHGLGAEPEYLIFKEIDGAESWRVWSKYSPDTATKALALNLTDAMFSQTNWIGAISSTTITIGSDSSINTSGNSYICYAFAPKKGYLAIGKYKGNGNADGPFIYTGFKPAFLLYKNTDTADSFFLHDNKRQGFNDQNELLFADSTQAESTVDRIRFTANGFKTLDSDKGVNKDGDTYVYLAIAEAPLVNSNGVPNNAR